MALAGKGVHFCAAHCTAAWHVCMHVRCEANVPQLMHNACAASAVVAFQAWAVYSYCHVRGLPINMLALHLLS